MYIIREIPKLKSIIVQGPKGFRAPGLRSKICGAPGQKYRDSRTT